ncbi:hypothetical protein [Bacillus cereus]|uniref:UmuC domain-containing protein n=1 Tax=Bacillus cereus HuA3-9 TaxID=1053205 RepID=R8CJF1_BACCE|nr:hypothetical protein IGA_05306 [Bacillus cereus HuA3-9]
MYDYSLCPNNTVFYLDLVSFFASVSCLKLGYDSLQTKLAVVSDTARPGSVVLAATKPLNQLGIKLRFGFIYLLQLQIHNRFCIFISLHFIFTSACYSPHVSILHLLIMEIVKDF